MSQSSKKSMSVVQGLEPIKERPDPWPGGPLTIKIVSGRKLVIRDVVGTSDPFCVVRYHDPYREAPVVFKTKIIKNDLNPVWNARAEVEDACDEGVLEFEVFDDDLIGAPDFMGRFSIKMSDIEENTAIDQWFDLKDVEHGSLRLMFLYRPNELRNPPPVRSVMVSHYKGDDPTMHVLLKAAEAGLCPPFVRVEAGTVQMGSLLSGEEMPRFVAHLTHPMAVAMSPVTRAHWQAVMGNDPAHFKHHPDSPVECVSWFNAVAYCQKLSIRLGLGEHYLIRGEESYPGDGMYRADVASASTSLSGVRLPTEAEWEYLARAGHEDFAEDDALDALAWHLGNSDQKTHGVANKTNNDWRIYDALGNVWEWCWDVFAPYPGPTAQQNPMGPSKRDSEYRVIRGGAWSTPRDQLRPSLRGSSHALGADRDQGFRPVLTLS